MQTVYKMEYREGSVRPIATWSPPRVRTALHLLQTGNFSQAAHLADAILGDGRVQAVLGTRINGVLGLPFNVDPADDSSGAAAIAEAAGKDFWSFFPEDASGELMRYGLMLGAVAAELVWVFEAGRLLPKLKVWHPSNLRYNSETQTYAVRLESGVEHPITPGDGKWMVWTPHSSRRPWTLALVRALAVPWLSKQFAAGDWNGYSEQLGKGVLKGGVPANARPEDKEDFKSDLRNLGSSGVVITPEGFTAELLEGRGQGWQTFESLIAWADKETAVTVLGQNLTTDVSGGSLAAAKVHENVRQDFLEADTETLATSLHEQVFTWYAEFNFGDRKLAPWPHWDAEPPADSKIDAETDKAKGEALTAIAAGAAAAGVVVDWEALLERMDIPIKPGEKLPRQSPDEGKIYEYHLKTPVLTRNEVRAKLGLEPLAQGGGEFVVIESQPPVEGTNQEVPPNPKEVQDGEPTEDLPGVGG